MHPIFKKMNAEEEGLSINQRLNLQLSDKTVENIMGPEPVPSLDIQMDEIQNELQRKMVEEIQCVVCFQFPYKPLECKSCNKLFCKYCQIQLLRGQGLYPESEGGASENGEDHRARFQQDLQQKMNDSSQHLSAGRDGMGMQKSLPSPRPNNFKTQSGVTPEFDICCPNCQARGDFMQEVNKVLKNCIDFCEFPHRCFTDEGRYEIIWKTLGELQAHAQFSCPKFGCDICYREEFQHMTRAQLFEHIKKECPEVHILCQVCKNEYVRAEFGNHKCIKDFYIDKLRQKQLEVLEHLADKLILHRRQKEGLGLCSKPQCVEQHRHSGNQYSEPMIAQNEQFADSKCFRCKQIVTASEDSYLCVYCNESYCPPCLGYCKFYELEEMDSLLLK